MSIKLKGQWSRTKICLKRKNDPLEYQHQYNLSSWLILSNHRFCFTHFSLPKGRKFAVKWLVHFLEVTAVTQSMVQTKANDNVGVCAKDKSPAVKGRIHGPVEEMFIRDE